MDTEFTDRPVPEGSRVAWPRVAAISAMVGFSLPTFITGLEVSTATGPAAGVYALGIGSIILTVIAILMGVIGTRTHLTSYLLVRLAFGDRGATLVNLAFALSLLGWFGVNIDLFGAAVARLLTEMFDLSVPIWTIEAAAGLLMTATTVFGFAAINRLSVLLVPVLALITAIFAWIIVQRDGLSLLATETANPAMSTGDAISATVGGLIIGAIILPDITRFCRHWTGAVVTALISYLIIEFIVMAAAGLAGASLGETEILDLLLRVGLGLSAFLIVVAGSWVLNSLNLYSTVLSVEATPFRFPTRWLTIGLGFAGIIAAFFNLLDAFLTFLTFLAVIFIPVAGTIIVDAMILRRAHYETPDFTTRLATNWPALLAWLIAAGYSTADLLYGLPSWTGVIAIDAVLMAAIIYIAGARLTAKPAGSV